MLSGAQTRLDQGTDAIIFGPFPPMRALADRKSVVKNLSLRAKFILLFCVIAASLGAAATFAWLDVLVVQGDVQGLYASAFMTVDAGRSAQRDFIDLRRHYISAPTMDQATWAKRYSELHDKVTDDLNRVRSLASTPEVRQRSDSAISNLKQWDSVLMHGQYASRPRQADSLAESLQRDIDENVEEAEKSAAASILSIRSTIQNAAFKLLIGLAVSGALGLLFSWALSVDILRQLERAVGLAVQIAGGNLSTPLRVDRSDETGQLLHALDSMRQSLLENGRDLKLKSDELLRLASTDALTGLANRRKLEEFALERLAHMKRYGGRLSVIILDIDHFKKVNDEFGHGVGDEVLRQVAQLLQNSVRDTDRVGRWGGEEFLIVSPDTPIEGSLTLADKVRWVIGNNDFPEVHQKTASLGVAEYAAGETFEHLVERADAALYRAKQGGRNRVEKG